MTMPVVMAVSMPIGHVACWIMALRSQGGLSGDYPADNRHRHLAHAATAPTLPRGHRHHDYKYNTVMLQGSLAPTEN
jgi:hypothetical protein